MDLVHYHPAIATWRCVFCTLVTIGATGWHWIRPFTASFRKHSPDIQVVQDYQFPDIQELGEPDVSVFQLLQRIGEKVPGHWVLVFIAVSLLSACCAVGFLAGVAASELKRSRRPLFNR